MTVNLRNIIWYLTVAVLSLPSFIHLIRPGYFPMHDDMQAMRVLQLDQCVQDGQIPCRWVPDMGYRYGYPQFHYYAPLPYYLMEAFHLSGLNILDVVKIGFILALLLGNLGMFALGKSLWGKWPALVVALLYAYMPYRASDLFSRGAMGESWAFVFLPLILLAILKVVKQPKTKSVSFLALAIAGLILSHNVSTLMFLPLAGIWGLVLLWLYSQDKKQRLVILKKLLLAGLWAIAIAAFFFLPVTFEKKFAHTETLLFGYFNYLAHFVTLKQLFFTSFWSYGSSQLGVTDDLSFFVSPLLLLLAILSFVFTLICLLRRRLKTKSIIALVSLGLALFALFMTHAKSSPIWNTAPFLEYLQFPWRFLGPANFFLSLAAGFFIFVLSPVFRARVSLVLVVLIFLFNASFFTPQAWYDISPQEKFSGHSWDKQLTISIFDYLPIFASHPPAGPAPEFAYSPGNHLGILDYQKDSRWLSFSVRSAATEPVQLILPQYDFPGWKVYLDKKKVNHGHDNELGLISLELPPGTHTVSARLTNTLIRTTGNLLSLIFAPLALYYFLRRENKTDVAKFATTAADGRIYKETLIKIIKNLLAE